MLVVLFIAPILGTVVGTFLAHKMFQKHFEKAGMI